MTYVYCPNDLRWVLLSEVDGMAECPTCHSILVPLVQAIRFGCDHLPRPLRGNYLFRKRTIPYEFCSMECKIAAEAEYPEGVKDLGLL